jgi:hypothetical protein
MTYLFIARFLTRGALIGARRCSSAKRRAAFTSLADLDPGHREARAGRVRQHNKLLRSVGTVSLSRSRSLVPADSETRTRPYLAQS